MRRLARRPASAAPEPAIDIVGTGGDASGSVNVSTGAALLVAALGVRVVKHGNRSVSSRSGSADLLECLGLPMPLDENAAAACLAGDGVHVPVRAALPPGDERDRAGAPALGVRTVFNLLGPLTNPAAPPFSLIGAYSPEAARLMAETLAGMAIERAFVVHGEPGWDEPTPFGPFELYDVRPGRVDARGPRSARSRLRGVARRRTLPVAMRRTMPRGCAPCSTARIAARIATRSCSTRRSRSRSRAA